MSRIAEYRDIENEPHSKTTVLKHGHKPGNLSREYLLKHHSAGWEPAGAIARWTDEKWSVVFYSSDGALNGRSFKTLQEAESLFIKWTST